MICAKTMGAATSVRYFEPNGNAEVVGLHVASEHSLIAPAKVPSL